MRRTGTASMAVRIGLALLVGALVPLAVLGGLVYAEESAHEREEALATLTTLATIQEARVDAFEQAAIATARQVATRTGVRTELTQASDGGSPDLAALDRVLRDAEDAAPDVVAASVTDRSGVIVASTRDDTVGQELSAVASLDLGDRQDAVLQVLGTTPPDGGAVQDRPSQLLVATPVALGGRPVGAVVIEVSLDPLVALAADSGGLGETGETLLAARTDDGGAVFLHPVRFAAGSSGMVAPDRAPVPITWALGTQELVLDDALDYRGEPVMAATRHLPASGLGLVVKIDREEALAPVAELRRLVWLGAAVAMVVAGVLAWALARRLARPISELREVTARIGDGELEARADTDAPGELGDLAETINQMATAIAAAQAGLEAEVAARTADLEDKIRELELRNEELDGFSSAVAHDLKSPLTVISGSLESIATGRVSGERAETLLGASANAARRMRALIDDLLVLARTGRAELTPDDVALEHVVAEVARVLDIEDLVEVEPLPVVEGDRSLLQQAIQNLLDNAAAYAGADGTPRIVVCSIGLGSETIGLAVDDNGRGIPAAERQVVFRPFTRGSSSAGTSGTGVGLAIVKRIAERHGGRATATDSPLGGTRMVLELPRSRVVLEAEQPTPL